MRVVRPAGTTGDPVHTRWAGATANAIMVLVLIAGLGAIAVGLLTGWGSVSFAGVALSGFAVVGYFSNQLWG